MNGDASSLLVMTLLAVGIALLSRVTGGERRGGLSPPSTNSMPGENPLLRDPCVHPTTAARSEFTLGGYGRSDDAKVAAGLALHVSHDVWGVSRTRHRIHTPPSGQRVPKQADDTRRTRLLLKRHRDENVTLA